MSQTALVLGASPKPDRYSHQAVKLLLEHGHRVIPLHPRAEEIAGVPVVHSLGEIAEPIDTVSLYLRPARLRPILEDLIALRPGRVIFSPGTEDEESKERLRREGIEALEACTLVLLRTGQF